MPNDSNPLDLARLLSRLVSPCTRTLALVPASTVQSELICSIYNLLPRDFPRAQLSYTGALIKSDSLRDPILCVAHVGNELIGARIDLLVACAEVLPGDDDTSWWRANVATRLTHDSCTIVIGSFSDSMERLILYWLG